MELPLWQGQSPDVLEYRKVTAGCGPEQECLCRPTPQETRIEGADERELTRH
jgi:hypothetical protein